MNGMSAIAIAAAVCGYLAWVTFDSLADPPIAITWSGQESKGGARCLTPPVRKPRCPEVLGPGADAQVLAAPFQSRQPKEPTDAD